VTHYRGLVIGDDDFRISGGGRSPFGPPDPSAPAPVSTSRVESFQDDLVPFLGDPNGSRAMGKALQIAAAVLVAYNLCRAALWAYFSLLSNGAASDAVSAASSNRIVSVGEAIDAMALLFWPTLIVGVVVDAVWRRQRRPKGVLQAHGEAYVEATLTRAVPVGVRVAAVVLVGAAFLAGIGASPNRIAPSEVAGFAASRALAMVLWALAWAALIAFVATSERHLARRVAKAADPNLAMFSVPYVEPEAERGTTGEEAGVGWILRTAGLVLVGLFSFPIVLASMFALPSGKDTAASLIALAIAGPILGLVAWAFVRRWKRRTPRVGR